MKKNLSTFSFMIIVISAIGQNKCNCEALIDNNFKGQVYLFDRPNGQVNDSIAHDTANEDKAYTGWLEKEMQCANPYTTCN